MHIPAALPVVANLAHRLPERIVVREERAAIAVAAERLGRKEAGGTDGRQVAALAALVGGTEALRRILDHREAVLCRDGVDLVHVGGLAVQRDRQDPAASP